MNKNLRAYVLVDDNNFPITRCYMETLEEAKTIFYAFLSEEGIIPKLVDYDSLRIVEMHFYNLKGELTERQY